MLRLPSLGGDSSFILLVLPRSPPRASSFQGDHRDEGEENGHNDDESNFHRGPRPSFERQARRQHTAANDVGEVCVVRARPLQLDEPIGRHAAERRTGPREARRLSEPTSWSAAFGVKEESPRAETTAATIHGGKVTRLAVYTDYERALADLGLPSDGDPPGT